MVFYKVMNDDKFIGVATEESLTKHQQKHNILVPAKLTEAQYIFCNDETYHDSRWMKPTESDHYYSDAIVSAIDEEEYKQLCDAIENNVEITVDEVAEEEPVIFEEELSTQEELTIEFIREVKTREMSLACNKAIMDGFDIELKDGKSHHFSMTMQDQMNLLVISTRILQGETMVAYHADGEEMSSYSADEMMKIISASNAHKEYHLAYFNAMKQWINSLKRITSVSEIEYGVEIPKKYQSSFLKSLSD